MTPVASLASAATTPMADGHVLAALGLAWVAGLLGSGHCVGMCGPFVGFAGTLRRGAWQASAGYQVGRLTAYLGLGVLAGVTSELLARAADLLALQRALAMATSATMVAVGVGTALGTGQTGRVGRAWAGVLQSASAIARAAGPRAGPYLLGVSASLLPCGFLWSFALAAAATGSMPTALATMLGFWLGTAPALLAASWLAGRLGQGRGRGARRLVGVALICLGVLGVVSRWGREPSPPASGEPACCHCADPSG